MRLRLLAALVAGTIMLVVVAGYAQDCRSDETSLGQFQHAVEAYAQLHRRLEQRVPALHVTRKAREIVASSDALAAALQAARLTAHEGDIFKADVADVFRARIVRALHAGGFNIEDVVTAGDEEAPVDAPWPVVNGRFPWARGAAMWPCVLNTLPSLPEELEYRIVGRDLVLLDVHANLVVDILREALR
jgi:hypothetical protein